MRRRGVIRVVATEAQHPLQAPLGTRAREQHGCGREPPGYDGFAGGVKTRIVAAEVLLRVDDEAWAGAESGFESWVARGEGQAVVAAFDDEVDGGEEGFHAREAGGVVA